VAAVDNTHRFAVKHRSAEVEVIVIDHATVAIASRCAADSIGGASAGWMTIGVGNTVGHPQDGDLGIDLVQVGDWIGIQKSNEAFTEFGKSSICHLVTPSCGLGRLTTDGYIVEDNALCMPDLGAATDTT